MCTTAWMEGENKEVSSVGELRALCGNIVVNEFYAGLDEYELGDNECLCSVDVPETLRGAGYEVREDPDMLGDWIFE